MTALSLMRLLPHADAARRRRHRDVQGPRSLRARSEDEMRAVRGSDIGMIFQEPMTSLNPVLTVGRQLTEAITAHERLPQARRAQRASALLDQVQIPEAERRLAQYPHELSGGMRQRVMIAIALSQKPDILIADEPTTALDVTVQAQILELIRTLQTETGAAVILITHDMGVVAEMADRVLVMKVGQEVEERAGPRDLRGAARRTTPRRCSPPCRGSASMAGTVAPKRARRLQGRGAEAGGRGRRPHRPLRHARRASCSRRRRRLHAVEGISLHGSTPARRWRWSARAAAASRRPARRSSTSCRSPATSRSTARPSAGSAPRADEAGPAATSR